MLLRPKVAVLIYIGLYESGLFNFFPVLSISTLFIYLDVSICVCICLSVCPAVINTTVHKSLVSLMVNFSYALKEDALMTSILLLALCQCTLV